MIGQGLGLWALSAENGTLKGRHDFGKELIEYAPNLAVSRSVILAGADYLYAFVSASEWFRCWCAIGEMPHETDVVQ